MNLSKTQFKCRALLDRFPQILQKFQGDDDQNFSEISEWNSATPKSLIFVSKAEEFSQAVKGPAAVIVTHPSFVLEKQTGSSYILVTTNVGLAQALVTESFFGRYPPQDKWTPGVHPSAVVAATARLGENVFIGPNAVVGEGVVIGNHTYIGASSVIEDNAQIGSHSRLWPQVFIGYACVLGNHCVVHPHSTIGSEGYGFSHDEKGQHHRIPQLGNVVLGNQVEIGANCTIDRAAFKSTIIGDGTKVDDIVHIAHNCTIGKNCIITSGFTMGGSSHLGDHIVVGGNVTVTDHVRIASNVRLAGLSGVSKSITESGDYGGYPLQKIKDHLKTVASLAKLPELRRRLTDLESGRS